MNEPAVVTPDSIDDLKQVFLEHPRLLGVGNRTKQPLSRESDAQLVSLRSIRGITQYEPSEFTFTAKAGTPLSDIVSVLAERGQYLPFDPMLADAGGTLGGTVAGNLAGPGRFRYGGVRDFLLGAEFLAGDGATINAGGKVVKNAAGFDIPKFLVGSLGRLGLMTQLTFKVFPLPAHQLTLRIQCESHTQALERIASASTERWEVDALDYTALTREILLRLKGPEESNKALHTAIAKKWGSDVALIDESEAESTWKRISELHFGKPLVAKVPNTHKQFLAISDFAEPRDDVDIHLSVGGAVSWIAMENTDAANELDHVLHREGAAGLVVQGQGSKLWLGKRPSREVDARIQRAMDPAGRFPDLGAIYAA